MHNSCPTLCEFCLADSFSTYGSGFVDESGRVTVHGPDPRQASVKVCLVDWVSWAHRPRSHTKGITERDGGLAFLQGTDHQTLAAKQPAGNRQEFSLVVELSSLLQELHYYDGDVVRLRTNHNGDFFESPLFHTTQLLSMPVRFPTFSATQNPVNTGKAQ
jgi:hypothetical protein